MNVTIYKTKPKDPLNNQVKVKNQKPSHEYVIPSKFATIPNNSVQSRIMRNAHNKKRFSLPPSIKEEEEETENNHDDEEENIPLAILAYRKGFITPDKEENVLPLVQNMIPPPLQKRYSDPCYLPYHHMIKNNGLVPHQFYQLTNYSSSSSNSSLSSTEFIPKRRQSRSEPKFYRRYTSK